ncbi:MAG: DegT/DnrJ/EryC1/StrS family aminotransferase [Vicingaceae bacterium]
MKIPLVDLHAQYLGIKNEIDTAIASVISESSFIKGRHVRDFQQGFAQLMGVNHCVPCGNGTDALYIVQKMLGIGLGDEVITTAHSWIATSETITQCGARVVFVDTTKDTFTIDPSKIEEKITDRTKAIIPVHLYGHPADMDPILEIARKYGLHVIEDCAQAHLAEYKGRKVGTMGHAATFSFYPGKNLGAMGDAGCIVTNDDELVEKCRRYAGHGALKKHDHTMEGINSRMDGLQAAVLNVKMKYIHQWTNERIRVAEQYDKLFASFDGIQTPVKAEWAKHVYHLYVIKTEKRDELVTYLDSNNIQTAIQYPIALPYLEAYSYLGHSDIDFPVARRNQDLILSIPMYPELAEEAQKAVVNAIQMV